MQHKGLIGTCCQAGIGSHKQLQRLASSSYNGGPDYSSDLIRIHDPGPGKPAVNCTSPAPGTNCSIYSTQGPLDGFNFDSSGTIYARGCSTCGLSNDTWMIAGTNAKHPGQATLLDSSIRGGGTPVILVRGHNGRLPTIAIGDTSATPSTVDEVDLNQKPLKPIPLVKGGAYPYTLGPDGCLYVDDSNSIERLMTDTGSCPYTPAVPPGVGLTLAQNRTEGPTGSLVTFTVHLSGASKPAGTQVTFDVLGANAQARLLSFNSQGVGKFSYTGVQAGLDSVAAMATVGGKTLTSSTLFMRWQAGRHVTYTSLDLSPTQGREGQSTMLSASLSDQTSSHPSAIDGQPVRISLGAASCVSATNKKGLASCKLRLPSRTESMTLRATYAGSAKYLPSSDSAAFSVIKTPVPIVITGRAVQNNKTVTFKWKVVSAPAVSGFNVIATGAHHANVQVNAHLIPSHASASYRFVAHNIDWDVDHFLLEVKSTVGATTQAGPFIVYEPTGKPS